MPSPTLLERIAGWPWEETLAVAFAAVWGGMLGSFLNVLAYRVPLGRTPLTGRSSCPRCGAPVRFRDNVPVIGWLVLGGRCRDCGAAIPEVAADEAELQRVNEALWDIEDKIRDKELAGEFDAGFIELARAVYVTNDERAAVKKRVNLTLGSRIVEEKSYKPYRAS